MTPQTTRFRSFAGLFFAGCLALTGLGCGAEAPEAPATDDTPPSPIAGMYEVSGVTVDIASGSKRKISGTLILAEDGSDYTATFNLATTFPGGEQELLAEVIGKGSGKIDGRTLRGEAQTQLVIAQVPGVDPNFAFIPARTTTRILSTSMATVAADGTATMEIENTPAPGQSYSPTRTTLHGRRLSAAGIGGAAEAAAARAKGAEAP